MSIIGVRRLVALGGSLGLVVALGGVRLADADTASAPSSVVAVSPYRILDTRNGVGTGGAVGKVGAGQIDHPRRRRCRPRARRGHRRGAQHDRHERDRVDVRDGMAGGRGPAGHLGAQPHARRRLAEHDHGCAERGWPPAAVQRLRRGRPDRRRRRLPGPRWHRPDRAARRSGCDRGDDDRHLVRRHHHRVVDLRRRHGQRLAGEDGHDPGSRAHPGDHRLRFDRARLPTRHEQHEMGAAAAFRNRPASDGAGRSTSATTSARSRFSGRTRAPSPASLPPRWGAPRRPPSRCGG